MIQQASEFFLSPPHDPDSPRQSQLYEPISPQTVIMLAPVHSSLYFRYNSLHKSSPILATLRAREPLGYSRVVVYSNVLTIKSLLSGRIQFSQSREDQTKSI